MSKIQSRIFLFSKHLEWQAKVKKQAAIHASCYTLFFHKVSENDKNFKLRLKVLKLKFETNFQKLLWKSSKKFANNCQWIPKF